MQNLDVRHSPCAPLSHMRAETATTTGHLGVYWGLYVAAVSEFGLMISGRAQIGYLRL